MAASRRCALSVKARCAAAWARARKKAPSPSDSAAKTPATRMSVPRTEERHNLNADFSRSPVNQPDSEADQRARSPELLVTGRIIFRTAPLRAPGTGISTPLAQTSVARLSGR